VLAENYYCSSFFPHGQLQFSIPMQELLQLRICMIFLRFQAVNFVQRIQEERRHPSSILTIVLTVNEGKATYRTMYLAYWFLISREFLKLSCVMENDPFSFFWLVLCSVCAYYLYIMQCGNLIYSFSLNRYLHKGFTRDLFFTLKIKLFTVQYVSRYMYIDIYTFTTGKTLTNIDFSMQGEIR
jgi:hypothetical protein